MNHSDIIADLSNNQGEFSADFGLQEILDSKGKVEFQPADDKKESVTGSLVETNPVKLAMQEDERTLDNREVTFGQPELPEKHFDGNAVKKILEETLQSDEDDN